MTIQIFELGVVKNPPTTLTYRGKRYKYLLDSTNESNIDARMNMIIKAGSHYPKLAHYTIGSKEMYAIYISKRVR